ncbi:hypothetical protein [Nesterenkonia sp. CF4.4]|uniref:hypothetical protein n=1 Tax=Nesterenkonia sp. CF4.4 TaxID=3373079 RepID=UPI003EE7D6F9
MDSRFPTHYLNDRRVLKATPPALRQFVLGTAWSVSNMTDGVIAHDDLPLVPHSSPDLAGELVRSGLWQETDEGYFISDFQKFQTSAAQLEANTLNRLERDRTRKQRDRRHERGDHSQCSPDKCTEARSKKGMSADSPRTMEGRGKGGGKEEEEQTSLLEEVDTQTGEIESTPDPAPISAEPPPAQSYSDTWPDDPPAPKPERFAPRDPRPFDFNQFRNPNRDWSDAK